MDSFKKFAILQCFLVLLLHVTVAEVINDPYVDCQMGRVIGLHEQVEDVPVHSYLGVPYAEPPIGPLRFRVTEPIYRKIRETRAQKARACIQHTNIEFEWYDRQPDKDEDCLYLNIWVPERATNFNPKSILFWIHGGGFYTGSNRIPIYNGKVLAALADIIVITVNYRLGPLGFAYSGTEHAPGNMGIHDIVTALKWVHKNIPSFGGDPNQITLGGQDAGAMIVTMLQSSPVAKDLFLRVLIQSGSASGVLFDNEDNLGQSQKLAEIMYCGIGINQTIHTHPGEIMECLLEQDADRLCTDSYTMRPSSIMHFTPRFGDELLPMNPRLALINGLSATHDMLIGVNQDEGSYLLPVGYTAQFGPYGYRDVSVDRLAGEVFLLELFAGFPNQRELLIHYLGDVDDTDYYEIRRRVYTAMGDYIFLCPTTYHAELTSLRGNSVYFYFFAHQSTYSPWSPWMRAAHGNELEFLFGQPYQIEGYTDEEKYLSLRVMDDFGHFVKTGKPRRFWKKYSYGEPHLVVFNATGDYIAKGPHRPNCDFFRDHFGFPIANYDSQTTDLETQYVQTEEELVSVTVHVSQTSSVQ